MVIAFVGMPGSGKSSAIKIVQNNFAYPSVYFGGVVLDYLKDNNLPITQTNEKQARELLRKQYGFHAMAVLSLDKILSLQQKNGITLIDGLYSFSEYEYLQKHINNLVLVAIHTNRPIRYQRLQQRKVRPLSIQQATDRDVAEIKNLEKGGPIAIADYHLLNNTNFDNFSQNVINTINNLVK